MVALKSAEDREAVVGDEAHIAAQSAGGPRWGQMPPDIGVNSYDNLVLLCRVHHKVIDDQPNHYTVVRLLEIKADHEKWVNDRLDDLALPGLPDGWAAPLPMAALTTGTAVWNLVSGSEAYLLTPPSDGEVEADAVDLADEFLQNCRDYGDLASEIADQGMASVREAKRTLQEYVARLASHGLLAFGTQQLREVRGYDPPVSFRVAIVSVLQADDPAIVPVPDVAARPGP